MTTFEKQEDGFEVPDFNQLQTRGASRAIHLDLVATEPLVRPHYDEPKQFAPGVLKWAQQILFLPHFRSTDHIFYGQHIDATDPELGFPTIRTARVHGQNYSLFVEVNHNYDDTTINVQHHALPGVVLEANNGKVNPVHVSWLQEQIFVPVWNELSVLPAVSRGL